MDDFLRFLSNAFATMLIGVALLLAAALLLFPIFLGIDYYGNYQCQSYQTITGKETRYNRFDICYIKTEVGWKRWDEYLRRDVAREELKTK